MALQSVAAVAVTDPLNPSELVAWFSQHSLNTITTMVIHKNVFYIVYF